jgi:hypothetical protein
MPNFPKSPERPSEHNPSNLTVRGHVYPRQSIARFADPATKMVTVYDLKADKKVPKLSPRSEKWFCAQWAWGERAESDKIEKEFQPIASRVAAGGRSLSLEEHHAVSRFFILWHLRAEWRENPEPDSRPMGVTPWSKEAEQILVAGEVPGRKPELLGEKLEKAGALIIRSGPRITGREMAGLHLWPKIDSEMGGRFKQTEWGVVTALQGAFVIPDYIPLEVSVVPVCPKICFIAGQGNLPLHPRDVAAVNSRLRHVARKYLIARDFAECQF